MSHYTYIKLFSFGLWTVYCHINSPAWTNLEPASKQLCHDWFQWDFKKINRISLHEKCQEWLLIISSRTGYFTVQVYVLACLFHVSVNILCIVSVYRSPVNILWKSNAQSFSCFFSMINKMWKKGNAQSPCTDLLKLETPIRSANQIEYTLSLKHLQLTNNPNLYK